MTDTYKKCGCGREYSEEEWKLLPQGGEQPSEDDSGSYVVELRHCVCRSTIGIEFKLVDGQRVRTE